MSKLLIGAGSVLNPFTEKVTAQVFAVMTPICIHCHRKISSKDGLFLYIPDPYFALIHKECAPFYDYRGLWPHSQPLTFYQSRNKRPEPGNTPSPGTIP